MEFHFLHDQQIQQASRDSIKLDVIITGEEWTAVLELCIILHPFEDVTSKMSAEKYLIASMALVLRDGLKNVCQQLIYIYLKYDVSIAVVNSLLSGSKKGLRTYNLHHN